MEKTTTTTTTPIEKKTTTEAPIDDMTKFIGSASSIIAIYCFLLCTGLLVLITNAYNEEGHFLFFYNDSEFGWLLVYFLILLVDSSIILIAGLCFSWRGLILQWLVLWAFACAFQFAIGAYLPFCPYLNWTGTPDIYSATVAVIIWGIYNVFFWWVLYIYYRELGYLQSKRDAAESKVSPA